MAHGVYEIWHRSARNYWRVIYLREGDIESAQQCPGASLSGRFSIHDGRIIAARSTLLCSHPLINNRTTSCRTMWNLFGGVYHVGIPGLAADNAALPGFIAVVAAVAAKAPQA